MNAPELQQCFDIVTTPREDIDDMNYDELRRFALDAQRMLARTAKYLPRRLPAGAAALQFEDGRDKLAAIAERHQSERVLSAVS